MKYFVNISLTSEPEDSTEQNTECSELKIEVNDSLLKKGLIVDCKITSLRLTEISIKKMYSGLENLKLKKSKWIQLPLFP